MSAFYLKKCRQFLDGEIFERDILWDGRAFRPVARTEERIPVVDGRDLLLAPSFFDLHVHLREPGYAAKETIRTGTRAAARGGFTAVAAMPNLDPTPDSLPHLEEELRLIETDALVDVLPIAAITKGRLGKELADIEVLAPQSIAFSDDGSGVADEGLMREAMRRIRKAGSMVFAHTEDMRHVLPGASVHQGVAAKRYAQVGIPSAAETDELLRDLLLVEETGCRYHVCHLSAKESVEAVRNAKSKGLPVTAEVTPHHLAFCDADIDADDGRYKMNPPLRSKDDRDALLRGIADGTIDCIATDHAPHTAGEKAAGLQGSAFGVVGLETAFAACYTHLVQTGVISLARLIALLSTVPRSFDRGCLPAGEVLIDLAAKRTIRGEDFVSRGHSTPFEGKTLYGNVLMTVRDGTVVFKEEACFRNPPFSGSDEQERIDD